LSADQGIAEAQLNYGNCLAKGDGIAMNKSQAAHYFEMSADQRIAEAQLTYGLLLARCNGIQMNK
jgi:TPR repeat protein